MQKLVCDGCGKGEPSSTPEKKRTIRAVRLNIVNDPRESTPDDRHDADLCPECRGHMLAKYFRINYEGTLELPSFLEPTTRERDERIAV